MKVIFLAVVLALSTLAPSWASSSIAVLPFLGKAHRAVNLSLAAEFVAQDLQQYLERKNLTDQASVVDYATVATSLGGKSLSSYEPENLSQIARRLGVRYLLFGESRQIYLGFRFQRFNVRCKVFDAQRGTVSDLGRARYTSGKKLMITWGAYPLTHPKRGKTFAKLSAAFHPFLDEMTTAAGD